ncbi:unnamed protein product [Cylicocyclus nassatus]|uniref:Inositol polyphosphate-related phosphatase domain-containing protein n=1 Tax=Cylicocyclus nassatus TaxID=53992 RepID=A0AA36H0D6_CYLNA|nr:unnamed protein product [Cylicocyclus nassatus]
MSPSQTICRPSPVVVAPATPTWQRANTSSGGEHGRAMSVMASEAAQAAALRYDPRADPPAQSSDNRKSSSSTLQTTTTTASAPTRSQSQGRPPWRTERRYTEIDDHTWKYTLNNEICGQSVVGFGNVPIPSKDNIAKLIDRKLSIRAITWNINEKPVKTLDLLSDHLEHIPENILEDIIIIALQELPPSTKTFHEDALAIIVKPLRQTHNTLISYRAWSQMIFVFIKKAHTRFATEPMAKFVPASTIVKPVRTKGAIGVCLRIYQRWTVIIASHLSHATPLQRIQDYHKIMRSLKFSTLCSFKGSDDIFHADCVLWLGDLNFRITEANTINWKAQLQKPNPKDIENTMESDELCIIRKKEMAFAEFSEAPIAFAPTHKFELNSNDYVQNRIPSYTDRVLYWSKSPNWLETIAYNCIQKASQSDHRPVYATMRLEVVNKSTPKRFNSDRVSDDTVSQSAVDNIRHTEARNHLIKEFSSQT